MIASVAPSLMRQQAEIEVIGDTSVEEALEDLKARLGDNKLGIQWSLILLEQRGGMLILGIKDGKICGIEYDTPTCGSSDADTALSTLMLEYLTYHDMLPWSSVVLGERLRTDTRIGISREGGTLKYRGESDRLARAA